MRKIILASLVLFSVTSAHADYSGSGNSCELAAEAIAPMVGYAATYQRNTQDQLTQFVQQMTQNPEFQFLVSNRVQGQRLTSAQRDLLARDREVFESFVSRLRSSTYTCNLWSYGSVNMGQCNYAVSVLNDLSAEGPLGTGATKLRVCQTDSDAQREISNIRWLPRPQVCADFDFSMPVPSVRVGKFFNSTVEYTAQNVVREINERHSCHIEPTIGGGYRERQSTDVRSVYDGGNDRAQEPLASSTPEQQAVSAAPAM